MGNNVARFLKWLGVLVFATLSTVAFSAPCDPDENTWLPSRYYPPGKTVFHKGHWYESRQLHEGKTPGSDFEWKRLASAPQCHDGDGKRRAETRQDSQPESGAGGQAPRAPKETARVPGPSCSEPGRWSFGASYTVGQMAVHGGETYRAIRPSNGQMPGTGQPPHWQPAEHPCKNRSEGGN